MTATNRMALRLLKSPWTSTLGAVQECRMRMCVVRGGGVVRAVV